MGVGGTGVNVAVGSGVNVGVGGIGVFVGVGSGVSVGSVVGLGSSVEYADAGVGRAAAGVGSGSGVLSVLECRLVGSEYWSVLASAFSWQLVEQGCWLTVVGCWLAFLLGA